MGSNSSKSFKMQKAEGKYAREMESYLKGETEFLNTLIRYRRARRKAKGNIFHRWYCGMINKNPMYFGIFKKADVKSDQK